MVSSWREYKSDLFVFTGDLINNMAWEVGHIFPCLVNWHPYGQFSILGNHDYGDYARWDNPEQKAANLQKLKDHLSKAMGYRLMLNENTVIRKNSDQLTLIGVIENWGHSYSAGDIDKALEGSG